MELGQINARIKNLKISGEWNGKIKVKFSLLNNLEALILYGNSKLDIYDLPNTNNDIYELRNLKYLFLSQFELSEKLNIEVTIPNLICFYLSFDEDSPLDDHDFDYEFFREKTENQIKDTSFESDIDYFLEFTNLKYLHLYFKRLGNNTGEGQSKTFICKKLEKDIFKCHYIYIDDFCRDYIQDELFYYNQQMKKKYNIKLNVSLYDPENWNVFDFDKDYNNYEEFKFETIYNPLFDTNIKTNNFSVKKILISLDDYDDESFIKGITHFINNITKFLSLREINISISPDLGDIFDSKQLNMLIKNLSTLKSLNIINIEICNSKIKVTEISSNSFEKMKIKKENDYISIFYVNFLNRIKSKKKI